MHKIKVGILGGGQLGMMLAEAANNLGLDTTLFCSSLEEPAARIIQNKIIAAPTDLNALKKFKESVDVIAIESEFFPFPDILADNHPGGKIIPELQTIRILSDKLEQKKIWNHHNIPSSPFLEYSPETSLGDWLKKVESQFRAGFVIKTAKNGYDGKGVLICNQLSQEVLVFCERALTARSGLYAEKKVNFSQELAIIGCRSVGGDFISYPLVKSQQKKGICYLVSGPATRLGISSSVEAQAKAIAKQISDITSLKGSFGIEFFLQDNGELLINEIAPRVHNSGHYSQDCCSVSQFENHWRCLLGMPLSEVQSLGFFAMLNILGPADIVATDCIENRPVPPSGSHLHWYFKQEIRPSRKLGHLNVVVDNEHRLTEELEILAICEQAWVKNLETKYKN
jgi:5-(carboxyamino)imidazole ribonucleotide synthase